MTGLIIDLFFCKNTVILFSFFFNYLCLPYFLYPKRKKLISMVRAGCDTCFIILTSCLILNGYNDWFLPSKEELKLIYTNLNTIGIGGFSNAPYWTSTEMNSSFAWEVIFNGGLVQGTGKSNSASVRAIRIF